MELNERQTEALTSEVRAEIIEILTEQGQASIGELAERLGRSPHSLYHHMRKLVEVGLVREGEQRAASTRPEVVYLPVSRNLRLKKTKADALYRDQTKRAARVAARRALRELERYQDSAPEYDFSRLLRVRARLTEEQMRELANKLAHLAVWMRSHDGKSGRLVSLTGFLAPVEFESE